MTRDSASFIPDCSDSDYSIVNIVLDVYLAPNIFKD